jgi:NB-ARC domain
MDGGIIAQIAVGRYILQIGEPCGAVIHEALRAERAHFRPRPTPILLRPRLIRGFVDRRMDLAAALSALDAGLAVEASGEPGIGKTALLRHLAHHPRAASFADGIVYVSARNQISLDLQQLIFEAFYESGEFCKPTEAEIRRGLQDKHALILLDDVHLPQDELEQVLDIAPRAAFVVATRQRRLWGEMQSLVLKGLPAEDAVLLLEREIERSLDATERSAAATLCAAIGGSPLRILQAAAVIREHGISLDGWARIITQSPIVNLMASIDEKERRALLALAALPGVPLRALHVSGIAEVTDIEPSLTALVRRGLVVGSQSGHQLADGVGDRLRRTEDLKPGANRAITYFTAWAERHLRSQDILLQESEALLRVQQYAGDARRSGEVLHLGRLLEGPLVVGARWGAWAVTLERCLCAAKAIGDRSAEAWALHELGSRALCLGEASTARALLNQAVKLRETLNDDVAAAASRRNLGFVLPPVFEYSTERATTPLATVLDLDSLPLRAETPPAIASRNTHSTSVVLSAMLLFAILGGLAYWSQAAGLSFRSWNLVSIGTFVQTGLDRARAHVATMRTPRRAVSEPGVLPRDEPGAVSSTEEAVALAGDLPPSAPGPQAPLTNRASILIFTPRPGSITTGGPTRLCYAVSEALQVRLEPDIGEVAPTRTLTCLRVAPARTTTYQLSAYGRDGHQVTQRLVIVVR